MAPIVWLALLLGYFTGLGGAFLLLPGPVIQPLYGVLGLVTLLVVVATALVTMTAGRRSKAPGQRSGQAAPDQGPEPGGGVLPAGAASNDLPPPSDGLEIQEPAGDRRESGESSSAPPASGEVHERAMDGDWAERSHGAQTARARRHEEVVSARELQALLVEGRADTLLRPLLGRPARSVELYRALPRLRAGDGRHLAPAQYLSTARRAGLTGLIDAILALRAAQLIWDAAAAGREWCVLTPIAPASLNDARLVGQLERLIARHPDLTSRLVLELDQLHLDTPAANAQARLRRLGWRFCLRRVGRPVFDLAALGVRGFGFVRLDGTRHARTVGAAASPSELTPMLKRLSDQGITTVVDRLEAAPELIELADRPLLLDDFLPGEARQSAA